MLLAILLAGMLASALLAVTVERIAYRPLRSAPRLIPLISAIGVSFFLQDFIRLVESIWRNATSAGPTWAKGRRRARADARADGGGKGRAHRLDTPEGA